MQVKTKNMNQDDYHWICNNCIGSNIIEDLTIGLAGKTKCEFCHKEFPRSGLRYVCHSTFLWFLKQISKDSIKDLHIRKN